MDNKEKLIKTSKICKLIAKVLNVASLCALLTFTVLAIVLPLTISISGYEKGEIAIIFSMLAVHALFLSGILWNVEKIFYYVEKKETPFSNFVNKYLKKTAIFTIISSIVPSILGATLLKIFTPNSAISCQIQLVGVVMGVVLFVLGQIFAYGCDLQKKDDETL